MKKTILAAVLMAVATSFATAQEQNSLQNVSVGELEYTVKEGPKSDVATVVGAVLDVLADQTTEEQPGYAEALRANVITGLGNVRRFIITDSRQVAPGRETNLIVDGTISYISITKELKVVSNKNDKKEKFPEYYAQMGVTLNLKDPTTGVLLNSQVFEVNKTGWTWVRTTDSAMKNALEKLRKMVEKYYNTLYPYTAQVLERGVEKKDKQKELYIDLGAAHGLRTGVHFNVYVIGKVGGKETRRQIGRLKVKSVDGDEVSLCKVVSGGRDIKDAIDAQKKLLIVSTD